MRNFLSRRGAPAPQREDVVRRQVISLAETADESLADERLRSEIRELLKDQQPGRYRVRVRRRLVRV